MTRRFSRLLLALGLVAGLVAGCASSGDEPAQPRTEGSSSATGVPAWRPGPVTSWQWQLTGRLDLTVPADVYELDAFTTAAADVAQLHAAGRRAICYVNVGAYEDFRPDAGKFSTAVIGKSNGWPGERWLDIRQWSTLEPLIAERLRMCRDKDFDGVEADNVDGYANESGFPLSGEDQLGFNRRVAALVHSFGLAAGLKNDLGQVADLQPDFEFAVNEECFRYHECEVLSAFTAAGKPVFHVEYDVAVEKFCAQTKALGFASMRKHTNLDAWRQPC
jgi:hypothetical protein